MVNPLVSTPYQASANVTSFNISLPASIVNGSGLVLFIGYSGGTTTVSSITGLTGLTAAAARQTVSGHSSYVYKRANLQSSDSGTTLTVTLSAAARVTACALVFEALDTTEFVDAISGNVSAAASTTITTPSVTTVAPGCFEVSLVCSTTGASPQITTFTAPGSITKDTTGLTSGGGTNPTAVSMGHDFTSKSAASSIGNRAWTADSSGSRSSWTLSIKPQNVAPTAAAGTDQTVAKGATVTLNGSATDTEGALATTVWTHIDGPMSVGDLDDDEILAPEYVADTAGRDTWRLTATDAGTPPLSAYDEVTVKVTDTTAVPDAEISNVGSYTVTGAGSTFAATNDSSDSTYISSPTSPAAAEVELRLTPMPTPADLSGVKVHVRMRHVNASSNSQSVKLVQGTTVIQSWTQAVTSSWVTYEFSVGATEAGNVTDWTDLRVRIAATAS